MDPSVFTFHISSHDAVDVDAANNCVIRIDRLPSNQKFLCEVVNCIVNVGTLDLTGGAYGFVTLTAEGLMKSGLSTGYRQADVLCDLSTLTGELKNKGAMFIIDTDICRRDIRFNLIDPLGAIIPTGIINTNNTTVWNLTLRLKPIRKE